MAWRRRLIVSIGGHEVRRQPPFADPEAAARKLVEIATGIEPVFDGRIFIELVNAPFLFQLGGKGTEFKAGIAYAVERGWLDLHESGSFLRLTKSSAEL